MNDPKIFWIIDEMLRREADGSATSESTAKGQGTAKPAEFLTRQIVRACSFVVPWKLNTLKGQYPTPT